MSLFIFIPPIILALLVERTRLKWLVIVLIIIVAAMRFPQLYGKNYTFHSYDFYATNLENLHSVNMNTLWTGKTEEYPERKTQAGIVDGEGILEEKVIKNSYRNYIVNAETDVRLVDYTFYFPGWKVIVDKQEVPIEFQDPQYRGIITYRVPPGEHVVEVVFADTQIRRVAKLSSLSFAIMIIVLFVLRKPIFGRIMKHV